jgi:hypothetical protein
MISTPGHRALRRRNGRALPAWFSRWPAPAGAYRIKTLKAIRAKIRPEPEREPLPPPPKRYTLPRARGEEKARALGLPNCYRQPGTVEGPQRVVYVHSPGPVRLGNKVGARIRHRHDSDPSSFLRAAQ